MSWNRFPRHVPVGERVRKATAAAARLGASPGGREPVVIAGKKIAETFWGKAWCNHLEAFSDYSNRLPRGRSYVRNGMVIDLRISKGLVESKVQGSNLYSVKVTIVPLPPARWNDFVRSATEKVTQLIDLLQGRLPSSLLQSITHAKDGLFPAPSEIKLSCSCPDWAGMCKHVAATLYGVGARLDSRPDLFFTLRDVDMNDLVAAAGAAATAVPSADTPSTLEGEDLSALFGVEIDPGTPHKPTPDPASTPTVPPKRSRTPKPRPSRKPSTARKAAPKRPNAMPRRGPAKSAKPRPTSRS